MFRQLSNNLTHAFKQLSGQNKLTEKNLAPTISAIEEALINADVALPVIQILLQAITKKAIGTAVPKNLKPDQFFKKVVHDELISILDQGSNSGINLKTKTPAVILLCGLQGAGKTTACAKLAHTLKNKLKKQILIVSTDTARPGAIQQLEILAQQTNVEFFKSTQSATPLEITKQAVNYATKSHIEILIIDTAGRLHIDENLMREIQAIHSQAKPIETLFVMDSGTGQDAAKSASSFNKNLPITGTILTKLDGDSKGGAALSAKHIINVPIKFISNSEQVLDGLHPLDATKLANQILDMGDLIGLVDNLTKNIDKSATESLAKKLKKGQFDLNDFALQIKQMQKIGGMQSLMNKMPGAQQYAAQIEAANPDKELKQTLAIIQSMTKKEKINPDIISGKRKRRISNGSGKTIPDVNKVLKQFKQMQKMIKKAKGGKLKTMLENLGLNQK